MKFRPNFLKRTRDVFLVCEKFRENAVMGAVLPLFYFVCKKKKSQRGFEIFCFCRLFYFSDYFVASFLCTAGAESKV